MTKGASLLIAMDYLGLVCSCAALLVSCFLVYRYYLFPASLSRKLRLHYGLHVLPYRPPSGNASDMRRLQALARLSDLPSPAAHHQILARVHPFYSKHLSEHQGGKFVYWFGIHPRIVVTDPEEVKQILSVDFKNYAKVGSFRNSFHKLFGYGLVLAEGADWHNQRTMLRPAFFPDKLKGMIGDMHLAALQLTEGWRQIVASSAQYSAEVEVARDLKSATADILARTSFGSDYEAGKAVFENQDKLLPLLHKNSVFHFLIPGFRYLPTPNNIKCWKVERSIQKELSRIVHFRTRMLMNTPKTKGTQIVRTDDLLSLMLASRGSSNDEFQSAAKSGTSPLTANQIIDECKTFFFAGHETTAHLLTWTMMLLSLHPDWQEQLREEIWEVCGRPNVSSNTNGDDLPAAPDTQQLNRLKLMSMVLYESLRLYPPVPQVTSRMPSKKGFNEGYRAELQQEEVQMGVGGQLRKLAEIPGMAFSIPTLIIQRDTSLWGQDAHKFQPQRFKEGVAKAASHPSAFLPFGFGPRTCIGQSFALLEAKVILVAILQCFRFHLSPSYKHAPISIITMKPQHGMQIILELLA